VLGAGGAVSSSKSKIGCAYSRRSLRDRFSGLVGAREFGDEYGEVGVLESHDIVLLMFVCWWKRSVAVLGT
jgi:hypothetical protein